MSMGIFGHMICRYVCGRSSRRYENIRGYRRKSNFNLSGLSSGITFARARHSDCLLLLLDLRLRSNRVSAIEATLQRKQISSLSKMGRMKMES